MDIISQRKVGLVQEEFRRLRQDIRRRNYGAVNERISHTISGINLLCQYYVGNHGETDITAFREEHQQFMDPIIQNNNLVRYYKVVRYLNMIHDY